MAMQNFTDNPFLIEEYQCPDVKLTFKNYDKDFLLRETHLKFPSIMTPLEIKPFPMCCGMRIITNVRDIGLTVDERAARIKLGMDIDNYLNYPGRYLIALPRNGTYGYYQKAYDAITKIGFTSLDPEPGYPNHVMSNYNKLFQMIMPKTNMKSKLATFCCKSLELF